MMIEQIETIAASSIRVFLPLMLVLVTLGLLAEDARAQAPQAADRHHIMVSKEGAQCIYELLGQADQDTLRVTANGRLTMVARHGVQVRVQIDDDPQRGVSGVQEAAMLRLDRLVPIASRTARGRTGQAMSEHKINIACCLQEPGRGQCEEWQDAVSRAELGYLGPLRDPPAPGAAGEAGPFAMEPSRSDGRERLGDSIPGGPVMVVME